MQNWQLKYFLKFPFLFILITISNWWDLNLNLGALFPLVCWNRSTHIGLGGFYNPISDRNQDLCCRLKLLHPLACGVKRALNFISETENYTRMAHFKLLMSPVAINDILFDKSDSVLPHPMICESDLIFVKNEQFLRAGVN